MASQLRVVMTPFPAPKAQPEPDDPPHFVRGLILGLEAFGAGASQAAIGSPKPAKLVFHMHLFKRVRGALEKQEERLAELEGSLVLKSRLQPIFVAGTGDTATIATLVYDDPELAGTPPTTAPTPPTTESAPAAPPTSAAKPRKLDLHFDASFQNMLDANGRNTRLLLPSRVDEFHYLELRVELEVAGSVEAPIESNDVLDVLIASDVPEPAPRYELSLLDDLEEPISGVAFTLDHDDVSETLTTDDAGTGGTVAHTTTPARAKLIDPAALRAELKRRWNEVRPRAPREPGPDVLKLAPDELEREFELVPGKPQVLLVHPKVSLARLFGGAFDTNKNFLLPSAIPALKGMKRLYDAHPNSKLLIVGHTDTSGTPSFNDALSLKRAEAVAQYLTNDVDAWLERYDTSVPEKERWGEVEDQAMIGSFPEAASLDEEPVLFYQKLHNQKLNEPRPPGEPPRKTGIIEEDGKIGPETRRALIEDYMAHDGTSLPDDIEIVTHGCGEYFPVNADGELDVAAEDGQTEAEDRRVELFFFDAEFGVQPPPPGKNSKPGSREYLEWRRRARQTEDFAAENPLRGLVLGWTTEVIDSLPASTVLQLAAGDQLFERTLGEGLRKDGSVHFEFDVDPRAEPMTLVADVDGEKLVLWDQQTFLGPEKPPGWSARLYDLVPIPDNELFDPSDEDPGEPIEEPAQPEADIDPGSVAIS